MRTIEEIESEFNEVKVECDAYLKELESEHSREDAHELIEKATALVDRLAKLNEERREAVCHRLDHKLTDALQSAINAAFGVEP